MGTSNIYFQQFISTLRHLKRFTLHSRIKVITEKVLKRKLMKKADIFLIKNFALGYKSMLVWKLVTWFIKKPKSNKKWVTRPRENVNTVGI